MNWIKEEQYKEHAKFKPKELCKISFQITDLTEREFAVLHPNQYHDILSLLFNTENKNYNYSFPISPKNDDGVHKPLCSGRMIYEFLELIEKDLVAEAHLFAYILKLDITLFAPPSDLGETLLIEYR